MDRLRELLEAIRDQGLASGQLRGLLHLLIGRKIQLSDGTVVSSGHTWREVASLLKRTRWDPAAVQELGLEPATLPPRDRERYWYTAIAQAKVDSPEARASADALAVALKALGYEIL